MTLKSIGLILALTLPFTLVGQLNLEWAFSSGSLKSDFPGSLVADSKGNLWTITKFSDTTDIDPGPGEDIVIPVRSNFMALSTFSADGAYLHSGIFDAGNNSGGGILEIKEDKMTMLLYFTDSLVFNYLGEKTIISNTPGLQACLLTLDTEGQVVDQYVFPYRHPFYFSDFFSLPDGSMILGGGFTDTFSFDPGSSVETYISRGGYDGIIAKLDSNHEVQWIKTYGSAGEDYLEDIFNDQDLFYFTMTHQDTIPIPTADGIVDFPSNGKDNNVFGAITLDGTIQHAFGFGGDLGDQVRNIVADSEGNMYICGYFEGEVNFQHPSAIPELHTSVDKSDGFVSKYTPEGLLVWTRIFTDTYYGGLYTMSLERGNELYLSGSFSQKGDLDPGPDSIIVQTNNRGDIYAVKLTTDGELKWVYTFPGTDFEGIRTVLLGADNNVYIQGYFYDSLDCNPTEDQTLLVSIGGSDFFIMGFTEENVISGTDQLVGLSTLVYPNPSQDEIHVQTDFPVDHVSVYAMDGTLLNLPVTTSANECIINLKGLTPGMYIVRTVAAGQLSASRIIKQ